VKKKIGVLGWLVLYWEYLASQFIGACLKMVLLTGNLLEEFVLGIVCFCFGYKTKEGIVVFIYQVIGLVLC